MSLSSLFENISPKEQAVYEAVISLYEEYRDTGSFKVSDIAARAGIGKGTVYEYFGSKDEIVAKALLYELERTMEIMQRRISKVEGIWTKMYTILDWIEEEFRNSTSFVRMLQIWETSVEIPVSIRKIMDQHRACVNDMYASMVAIIQGGIEEGILSAQIPISYMVSAAIGNFITYVLYLNYAASVQETDVQGMKEFIFRSIQKVLTD